MRRVETQGILNQAYHKGLVEGKRKMEDKLLQFAEQESRLKSMEKHGSLFQIFSI